MPDGSPVEGTGKPTTTSVARIGDDDVDESSTSTAASCRNDPAIIRERMAVIRDRLAKSLAAAAATIIVDDFTSTDDDGESTRNSPWGRKTEFGETIEYRLEDGRDEIRYKTYRKQAC